MLNQSLFLIELANVLHKIRKNKGFTFERLSEISSVDYSTLNLIEHSKQNPRMYTIYKILYALNVDFLKIVKENFEEQKDKKIEILTRMEMLDLKTLEALDVIASNLKLEKK